MAGLKIIFLAVLLLNTPKNGLCGDTQRELMEVSGSIIGLLAVTHELNKHDPSYYTTVGFGFTNGENIFCLQESLNTYGVITFGYAINDQFSAQIRHNSCVDKDTFENSINGLELIFTFK